MGVFRETCMLSNTPLFYRDICRGVFIAKQPVSLNKEYPESRYAPISPVFFGEYYDTGFIMNPHLGEHFTRIMSDGSLYERFDRNLYSPVDTENINTLMNRAASRSLFLKIAEGNYTQVRLAIMLDQFYWYAIRSKEANANAWPHISDILEPDRQLGPVRTALIKHTLPKQAIEDLTAIGLKLNAVGGHWMPTYGANLCA